MAEDQIAALLRDAPISFVGTVEHTGAATMADLPIDERTVVVNVVQVLHAPAAFSHLAGHRVTMQVAPNAQPPAVGETAAFFCQGLAFGESLAVSEIGRASIDEIEPHIRSAAEAGERGAFAPALRAIQSERLRAHATDADAIVLGRVVGLEKVTGPPTREHHPDWWRATIEVEHVESGDVPGGQVTVLYPNSLDVRWATVPKPKASQEGMWLLHATQGDLRELAPFQIEDPDDYQPAQTLETIRGTGS